MGLALRGVNALGPLRWASLIKCRHTVYSTNRPASLCFALLCFAFAWVQGLQPLLTSPQTCWTHLKARKYVWVLDQEVVAKGLMAWPWVWFIWTEKWEREREKKKNISPRLGVQRVQAQRVQAQSQTYMHSHTHTQTHTHAHKIQSTHMRKLYGRCTLRVVSEVIENQS